GGGSGGAGGNARKKGRRGGTPPTPGPTPGQPPGAAPFAQSPVAFPPNTAPAPFAASLPRTAPPQQPQPLWSPPGVPPTAPSPYAQAPMPVPVPVPVPMPGAPSPHAHGVGQPVAIAYAHIPTAPPKVSGTSFPTPCPNPACGKSVMIPPGGSAQCAFCGSMVDARGQLIGEVPAQGAFGLTGKANEQSAARAVAAAAPLNPSTLALQGPSGRVLAAALLQGQAGNYRVLAGIECKVGRDGTQCSVALQETRVSSVHATLKVEGPTLMVRDDRSHNGTFVNGNRIAAGSWVPVAGGSQLRFGPIEFVVQYEA
ncbi:MAG: FHA domain-containing protein, partial [Polyangiales bacterium]